MYKYEQDIQEANERYVALIKEAQEACDGYLHDDDCEWAKMHVFGMSGCGSNISMNVYIAIQKHYKWDREKGYIRKDKPYDRTANAFGCPGLSVPELKMPFALSDNHSAGLYFLGMIGVNPAGQEYYLVKIGAATDIAERVNAYAAYNPMIYHNNIVYNCTNIAENERKAHEFLAKISYARGQKTREWFYVSKPIYYNLCRNPWKYIFKEG